METNTLNNNPRVVLHVDMDAFFASIEQRDNPALRNHPVVVGGNPHKRGVVSAASYEARKFGIHSAMPTREAFRRCPTAAFILPRMDVYSSESAHLMRILSDFSPLVEQISIDEAFIDISGTQKLLGSPLAIAQKISQAIQSNMNLTASIGVAPNKFLAKIASDCNKPNGITLVPFLQKEIISWLAPMPLNRIWGIGEVTTRRFEAYGICTIGDLQQLSDLFVETRFGSQGVLFKSLSMGIDTRTIGETPEQKTISREHTFATDCNDFDEIRKVLLVCATKVSKDARELGVNGKTVIFTYRLHDFSRHTKRITLADPIISANQLFKCAAKLFEKTITPKTRIRLAGLGITNLESSMQQNLFADLPSLAWSKSEVAEDLITARFGKGLVKRGVEIRATNKDAQ